MDIGEGLLCNCHINLANLQAYSSSYNLKAASYFSRVREALCLGELRRKRCSFVLLRALLNILRVPAFVRQ